MTMKYHKPSATGKGSGCCLQRFVRPMVILVASALSRIRAAWQALAKPAALAPKSAETQSRPNPKYAAARDSSARLSPSRAPQERNDEGREVPLLTAQQRDRWARL